MSDETGGVPAPTMPATPPDPRPLDGIERVRHRVPTLREVAAWCRARRPGRATIELICVVVATLVSIAQWRKIGDNSDETKQSLAAIKKTAESTERLAALYAKQLERIDRPYIAVSTSSNGIFPLHDSPANGTVFGYNVMLMNEGKSPAFDLTIASNVLLDPTEAESAGAVGDLCRSAAAGMKYEPGVLRPGEGTKPSSYAVTLADSFVASRVRVVEGVGERILWPVLVGCVAYRIPYSEGVHYTTFAKDIYGRGGLIDYGSSFQPSEVEMRPSRRVPLHHN